MKRITLSLSLLPLLLSSCSNQKSFGNWKNDDLPYLDRNGDNAIANKWTSVNDLTITVEGEDLIPIVERGESFFLCFSRETCSHCQAISEQMISFLEKSDLAIYRNEMATISSMKRFVDHYSDVDLTAISSHYETPTFFFVESINQKPKATYFRVANVGSDFSAFFQEKFNRTEIYHFYEEKNLDGFLSKSEEALLYFDDGEHDAFYREELLPLAKKSDKPLLFVDKKMNHAHSGGLASYKKAAVSPAASYDYVSLDDVSSCKSMIQSYFA